MRPAPRSRLPGVAAVLCLLAATTACAPAGPSGGGAAGGGGDRLDVLTPLPALTHVVEQVGGEHVTVEDLVVTGANSHDLELTPAQVARVGRADAVVHLSRFQPALDDALELRTGGHVVDAAEAAALETGPGGVGGGASGTALDPHFWLDPTRLAAVGDDVAAELAALDPDHAGDYRASAARLGESLEWLDAELATALAPCRGATLVTSHEAFGYLAQRYGLTQVGIAGLDPEVAPSPARLREVVGVVQGRGVETVFFETSTGPGLTEALADDLDVGTGVLDPVERTTDDAGSDYPARMRANLRALQDGLACAP